MYLKSWICLFDIRIENGRTVQMNANKDKLNDKTSSKVFQTIKTHLMYFTNWSELKTSA